jgi:hypothetical protein
MFHLNLTPSKLVLDCEEKFDLKWLLKVMQIKTTLNFIFSN